MFTALIVLAWGLVAVLALLLGALAMPLHFEFRASAGEALRYSLALRPFGRFGPRLTLTDSEKPSRSKTPKSKKKTARRGRLSRRHPKRFAAAAFRLLAEFFGKLRIEDAKVHVRFGAGDPAETGQIYGALTPLIYGGLGFRWFRFSVEPVFERATFDGHAALDISLTPIRLLPPVLRFGWAAFGPQR